MVWKARMFRVVVPARRASWSTVRLTAGAGPVCVWCVFGLTT